MAVNTKDKYYTPDWLVEHTIKKAIEIIGKENIREIVEPSAGDGAFIESLKKAFPDLKQRYYDLYPEHPEVIEQNYKEVRLTYKKGRLTIGNPPFGKSSSLWKAFCKKAATNSDYIVYISPASQYKSNYYFKEGELIYSELLNDVEYRGSEVEGGKATKVRTCLNIYKVYDREEEEDWRIKRLEQDVKIHVILKHSNGWYEDRGGIREEDWQDYDYFITYWGEYAGDVSITPVSGGSWGVKILNESRRPQIVEALYKVKDEFNRTKGEERTMNMTIFKSILVRLLYPSREERLEQDVLIKEVRRSGKNKEFDADFYIGHWGAGAVGKMFNEIHYEGQMGVKILNENRRKEIEDFFKTYNFKDNLSYTGAGVYVDWNILKQYLIKHLYPTREERLEQDVIIERDNKSNKYDFIIDRRGWNLGKLLDKPEGRSFYGIKVLNENMRTKIESVIKELEKDFKIKAENDLRSLSMPEVKEHLIKHLYPTREERLEQDVLIYTHHIQRDGKVEGDYFIRLGYTPELLKECPDKTVTIVIKVLNESIRIKLETVLNTIKIETINNINLLKEILIKHLYPTREERLEQDILIVKEDENPDYYMTYWGDAGHIDKIKKTSCVWPIKILNENIRQRFESSFDIIKQKINEHPTLNIGTGGSKRIKEIPMKEVLMKVLYDDDPSFDSYDDIYPEVKKPIKIERAQFAKPLFEESYIEEIVKAPVDSSTMKAVALF